MKADIVLFNSATVHDTSTIERPQSPPVGLPYVFVNGTLALDNGVITGQHPGAVLRRSAPINRPLRP